MSEIFSWLLSYFGLGLLGTAGCIAAAVFVPFPLKHYVIGAAIAVALATSIYGKGRFDEKQEWNAAIVAQIKVGEAAHDGAVSDVARGVRDHHDRDQQQSGVRAVARDRLLIKK